MTARDRSTLLTPLELQPAAEPPRQTEFYELDELVRYHDRAFIDYAYVALARRAPTPEELGKELDDLRSGRRDKVQIIEDLLNHGTDAEPKPRVVGLRSPTLRRVSHSHFIGYLWRWLRALTSLHVQLRHQQQSEAYLLGQQQRIADYINVIVAPAIADWIEAVTMLADSLGGHLTASEEAWSSILTEQKRLQTAIATQYSEVQEKTDNLGANIEAERARVDARLNQLDLNLNAERARLVGQQEEFDKRLNAQQELIVQEQRVIVETQKVVMEQLRADIRALTTAYEQQTAELLSQVRRLQASVDAAQSAAETSGT